MPRVLGETYDQSSYIKIKEDMDNFDNQVDTMRDIAKQLVQLGSNAADNHMKESAEYVTELETLTQALFDISHKQETLGINRNAFTITFNQQGPQLPVLALKPDRLSFSMTTADLHIWKDAYKVYHQASGFQRYPLAEHQVFLLRCLDNDVAIRLNKEATNTTYIPR